MATNILSLYNEYKKGFDKLKKKKNRLIQDEEKNKEKIKKVNDEMIKFQLRYAKLWLNVEKGEKNEQS